MSNAPLIVPYGTKNEYLGANSWKNFKKIIEEEKDMPTGLSSAHSSSPARSQLYNLQGQKLGCATRRGIYIRDGKKIANF